jgi:hypothetical protein
MVEDLIFTILMLILPAILWIVPKTRRNNGNWLIAWKTVPLGFIAICWTGWLMSKFQSVLSERLERNIDIPFWVSLVVPLTVAFLVIIPGGLFIRRKFGTEKKYNPGPSILIFLAAVPHVIILSWILSFVCDLGADDYKGEWRTAWLPKEGNTAIAFQEQPIHPFLAEYNYRLLFSRDGEQTYQLLLTNTGGSTYFNVYRLKDGRLLFCDKEWDYLVDVQGPECRVFRVDSLEDRLYAARIPNEKIGSWSIVPIREDDQIVMRMGDHTVPAEDVTGILDGMTYYGCIQDRFYPADQKPEQTIKKMFEKPEPDVLLY